MSATIVQQGRAGGRPLLRANLDLYVNDSTGSDSNNGSSGAPVATIQKAVDLARGYDPSIYTITINIADGTYTDEVEVEPTVAGSRLYLLGDTGAPGDVIVSCAGDCFTVRGRVNIQGIEFRSSGGRGLKVEGNGDAEFGNVIFGACSVHHIDVGNGAYCRCVADYEIDDDSYRHIFCWANASYLNYGFDITLTGTPAFSGAFAEAKDANIEHGDNTFTGSATGTRSIAIANGVINNTANGVDYLPGNASGYNWQQGIHV